MKDRIVEIAKRMMDGVVGIKDSSKEYVTGKYREDTSLAGNDDIVVNHMFDLHGIRIYICIEKGKNIDIKMYQFVYRERGEGWNHYWVYKSNNVNEDVVDGFYLEACNNNYDNLLTLISRAETLIKIENKKNNTKDIILEKIQELINELKEI